jgi:hypothetical protein
VRGGVDGRVADTELVRPVEREDRLTEGDVIDAVGWLDALGGRRGLREGGEADERQQKGRETLQGGSNEFVQILDPPQYYTL